jgi:hypothetical protein
MDPQHHKTNERKEGREGKERKKNKVLLTASC